MLPTTGIADRAELTVSVGFPKVWVTVELTPIGRTVMSWWQKALRARMFVKVRTLRSAHFLFSLMFPHLGNFREKILEKPDLIASKNPSTKLSPSGKTQVKRSVIHSGTPPGTLGTIPSREEPGAVGGDVLKGLTTIDYMQLWIDDPSYCWVTTCSLLLHPIWRA